MDYKQIQRDVVELTQYADLDGSEWGEMITSLCALASRLDFLSKDMVNALAQELSDNVEYVRANARIVKRTEMRPHTYYDVEWDDR